MEYQEWKKKKERSDNAWTGIIILAFICFWPAGIALVILKNAGKLPILGTGQTLQQWRQTLAHLAQQQPAAAPPPASPKQQDRAKRKLKFGGPLLGTGITLAAPLDENAPVPSCRNADAPYHEGQYVLTVDGFLVSGNVTVEEAAVLDTGFAHSDHNPVSLTFTLNAG